MLRLITRVQESPLHPEVVTIAILHPEVATRHWWYWVLRGRVTMPVLHHCNEDRGGFPLRLYLMNATCRSTPESAA